MLRSINVDAVIVAEPGLLRLIKDSIKMPVHASTQMGIDSLEGVLWAQEEGIERVILARELSLAPDPEDQGGQQDRTGSVRPWRPMLLLFGAMPFLQHAWGAEAATAVCAPSHAARVRDRW